MSDIQSEDHEAAVEERIAHYRRQLRARDMGGDLSVSYCEQEAYKNLVHLLIVESIHQGEHRRVCLDCEGSGVLPHVDGDGDRVWHDCDECCARGYTWSDV